MGLIICAAQTRPVRGDIDKNLIDQYHWIELAATNGAQLIVFPEMSITGYEREDAHKFSFSTDDKRLETIKKLSTENKLIIIAGAPIQINNSLFIGSFIFQPSSPTLIYTKQFLHDGEEQCFSASHHFNPTIKLESENIQLAICADIDHSIHPENAAKNLSTLYIPSIFFSPQGIPKAYQSLALYSKNYQMNILMSNYVGESYGMSAGGQSGFWNNDGHCISSLNDVNAGLLLIEKNGESWRSKIIYE
ncbi:MAG: carbon-nitrogen hydrolase family protein [Saprospiraceae bacterium]|nr:carbon-nitrogen hydrolase family protein [Candidatus Defluviibacterium haderslevense]